MQGRFLAPTLASYVDWLRAADDEFRLRIVLHDFGLAWESVPAASRRDLVADEPDLFDARWDAFLASYAEHLCWHEGLEAPSWVFEQARYLDHFWFAVGDIDSLKVEAVVHAPAAFEAHGVLISDRELIVV